jgi:multidrug efflux pump subunit AcrA (membrane-fusion protein)
VKLYPQVDRQKGTLKVEVQVLEPDAKLLPDMSARVTFLSDSNTAGGEDGSSSTGGEKAVLIPAAALRTDERGDTFVWVVSEGRVRAVTLETGGTAGESVRVTSGLKGGEAIVLGDDAELRDGQKVAVTGAP